MFLCKYLVEVRDGRPIFEEFIDFPEIKADPALFSEVSFDGLLDLLLYFFEH